MKTLGLIAIALLLAMAVFALRTRGTPPPPTHDMFAQGDCAECHEQAPAYHLVENWAFTHGRAHQGLEESCEACHSAQSCNQCHDRAPVTHTPDFRNPGTDTVDAERHAVVARVRPSACGGCHQSLAEDCTKCHTLGEVDAWSERARVALARWQTLLGAR